MGLLREAIRLEKMAKHMIRAVQAQYDDGALGYHLNRLDAETALDIMVNG